MLVNVRRLSEPKMGMGLTGPQAIKFTGDLCLEMLNTTGKSSKIVVKDVYHISPVDKTGPDNNSSEIDATRTTHDALLHSALKRCARGLECTQHSVHSKS